MFLCGYLNKPKLGHPKRKRLPIGSLFLLTILAGN